MNSMLERLNMTSWRTMIVPVPLGITLFVKDCPKSSTELDDISSVSYVKCC